MSFREALISSSKSAVFAFFGHKICKLENIFGGKIFYF